MKENNKKGISTPFAVGLTIIFVVVVGLLSYHANKKMLTEELYVPALSMPEKVVFAPTPKELVQTENVKTSNKAKFVVEESATFVVSISSNQNDFVSEQEVLNFQETMKKKQQQEANSVKEK